MKKYTDLKAKDAIKITKRSVEIAKDKDNKPVYGNKVMLDKKIFDQETGELVQTHSKEISLDQINKQIAYHQEIIDDLNAMKTDFATEEAKAI